MSEPAETTKDETKDDQRAGAVDTPDAPTTSSETDSGVTDEGDRDPGQGRRNVFSYLEWAGLGLCVVLVLVAGLRVYWGVGAFISLWVASKYEPIVSAGFNLAVLLLAAYGIALLSRRLTATS